MKYASCWQLITMSATDTGNITITGCCIELPTHFKKKSFYGFKFSGCQPRFSQNVVKGKIK